MTAIALGACALGRAIDHAGFPLDGGSPLEGRRVDTDARVPLPNERAAFRAPLWTGVRAIDGLLTLARGSRIGIFGAPGTGKSSLLESIVDGCRADAVVIVLVGERGREARHWIERCDRRTTVVCATSDRSANQRIAAARVGFAHAAALRERGLDVVLAIDSLARYAAALRERALAAGEIAGRGGYPPSVFAAMAALLEVAGPLSSGSIGVIASVLSDGDERDPVCDAARSLLDGHIALSERRSRAGQYPAIDVVASVSRAMNAVASTLHCRDAVKVRAALALLDRLADVRAVGAEPCDPISRRAIEAESELEKFLCQDARPSSPSATLAELGRLADTLEVPDGHQ